ISLVTQLGTALSVRDTSQPAGPCSSGGGFRPRPPPTVRSVVQPEGEVVLGASPPARPLRGPEGADGHAGKAGMASTGIASDDARPDYSEKTSRSAKPR